MDDGQIFMFPYDSFAPLNENDSQIKGVTLFTYSPVTPRSGAVLLLDESDSVGMILSYYFIYTHKITNLSHLK